MQKIALLTIFFLFLASISVQAQTKRARRPVGKRVNTEASSTKPEASPDVSASEGTTRIATTQDGRTVDLNSNGTWKYRPQAAAPPVAVRTESTLSFQTGLVLKSGNVQPVARSTFYLLDKSVTDIMTEAGLQPDAGLNLTETLGMAYFGRRRTVRAEYLAKVIDAIKPHTKAETTTDFNGAGQFPPVPFGNYVVFAVAEVGRNTVVWNATVELKTVTMSVALDQNNAAAAF